MSHGREGGDIQVDHIHLDHLQAEAIYQGILQVRVGAIPQDVLQLGPTLQRIPQASTQRPIAYLAQGILMAR